MSAEDKEERGMNMEDERMIEDLVCRKCKAELEWEDTLDNDTHECGAYEDAIYSCPVCNKRYHVITEYDVSARTIM